MTGKTLYPNTSYFTLAKELPGAKIGDVVTIHDADGDEYMHINGFKMPIDCAVKYPEWFTAVTPEEHSKLCKENTIKWAMEEKGCTREEAEKIYESM